MTDDTNDPLRSLEREADPPPFLKARVVRSLRQRGLLRGGARPTWRIAGAVAAMLTLFVAGVATGRLGEGAATPPVDTRSSFMLLLYEDASFRYDRSEAEFVAEYSAWAGDLARRGALVSGEKLDSTSRVLREGPGGVAVEATDARSDLGVLAGFFIVRAANEAEALQIAQSCPHLGHGGRIALRPVART